MKGYYINSTVRIVGPIGLLCPLVWAVIGYGFLAFTVGTPFSLRPLINSFVYHVSAEMVGTNFCDYGAVWCQVFLTFRLLCAMYSQGETLVRKSVNLILAWLFACWNFQNIYWNVANQEDSPIGKLWAALLCLWVLFCERSFLSHRMVRVPQTKLCSLVATNSSMPA